MKRNVPIAIPPSSIGADGQLTDEGLKRAKAALIAELDLSPDERADLEAQLESMVGDEPFLAVSARSIAQCMERVDRVLETLPQGLLALAQAVDTPAHVFELGSVESKIQVARGLLISARRSLDETMACHFGGGPHHREKDKPS